MGIKSGYTFLVNKQNQKVHLLDESKTYGSDEKTVNLKDKVVVVDGGILFKLVIRSDVALDLHTYDGPVITFAMHVDHEIVQPLLKNHGVRGIIIVLDGAPYPPKKLTQQTRRKERKKYGDLITELHKELEESKWGLNRSGNEESLWKTLKSYYKKHAAPNEHTSQSLLGYFNRNPNVAVVRAPFEADHQVVYLQKNGFADYIIGEDSDLIAMGGDNILAQPNFRDGTAIAVTRDKLKSEDFQPGNERLQQGCFKEYTDVMLATLCAMCGNDFLPGIRGRGYVRNVKFLQEHFETFKNDQPLPDVSKDAKYCNPRGGEVVVDYWKELKRSVQAMLGSPVVAIYETTPCTTDRFKSLKSKDVITCIESLTTGYTWDILGITEEHMESLKLHSKEVFYLQNDPKHPQNQMGVCYSMADLTMSCSEIDFTNHSVFRYFPQQICL